MFLPEMLFMGVVLLEGMLLAAERSLLKNRLYESLIKNGDSCLSLSKSASMTSFGGLAFFIWVCLLPIVDLGRLGLRVCGTGSGRLINAA